MKSTFYTVAGKRNDYYNTASMYLRAQPSYESALNASCLEARSYGRYVSVLVSDENGELQQIGECEPVSGTYRDFRKSPEPFGNVSDYVTRDKIRAALAAAYADLD